MVSFIKNKNENPIYMKFQTQKAQKLDLAYLQYLTILLTKLATSVLCWLNKILFL